MRIQILSITILLAAMSHLQAADDTALPPPEPGEHTSGAANSSEEIPSSVPRPGEIPEVTITPKPQTKVEEYRVNGKVRYIKITPTSGKPYYLLDTNGDGEVDSFESDVSAAKINQWLLMEF